MEIGNINNLIVDRETPISFVLLDDEEEIFLHKKEVVGSIKPDDEIDAFLYYDHQKRIAATMNKPYCTVDQPAFIEVCDINPKLGIFMNIGISRDVLMSKEDLPYNKAIWPQIGDKLFCRLKDTKTGLLAKMVSRFEISDYLFPDNPLIVNEEYEAIVIRVGNEGINLLTEEGHKLFIYKNNYREQLKLGQRVNCRIINAKNLVEYNASMIKNKEIMLSKDANTIIKYLSENGNEMPYGDKSTPEEINEVFNMSKSSFKRALGTLMKKNLINQKNGKTYLI